MAAGPSVHTLAQGSLPPPPRRNRTAVADRCGAQRLQEPPHGQWHHSLEGLHAGGGQDEYQLPAAFSSHGHLLAQVPLKLEEGLLIISCNTRQRDRRESSREGTAGPRTLLERMGKRWTHQQKTTFLFDLPFFTSREQKGSNT